MRGKKRSYALFSLVTTLFEEAGLAAIVLLLLPQFGIIGTIRKLESLI